MRISKIGGSSLLAELHSTAGCHPTSTSEIDKHPEGVDGYIRDLKALIEEDRGEGGSKRIISIGEIGLGEYTSMVSVQGSLLHRLRSTPLLRSRDATQTPGRSTATLEDLLVTVVSPLQDQRVAERSHQDTRGRRMEQDRLAWRSGAFVHRNQRRGGRMGACRLLMATMTQLTTGTGCNGDVCRHQRLFTQDGGEC